MLPPSHPDADENEWLEWGGGGGGGKGTAP